ncbi:hypothetical protein [Nonlabens antarcticus]|uniref:hypothetical protein n=1 Tax=Nonlabens antarcticus TaxID=392714 RepID=UPI001891DBA3|nr:hypothetical protein [Nonlabens antarcticus]
MNAFLGNRNSVMLFIAVILFAFAKANSQQAPAIQTDSTFTIDKLTTRADLMNLLKTLREEYQLEVKLTDFQSSASQINSLGLELKGSDNRTIDYQTASLNGIDGICIDLLEPGTVSFLGLCSTSKTTKNESQTAINKEVNFEEKESQQLVSTDDAASKKDLARQERLLEITELREQADQKNTKRLEEIENQKAEKTTGQIQVLEVQKDRVISDTQTMKAQQIAIRAELKQLENESNRIKRERKTLDYNNLRALAKRDSLEQHQIRLIEIIEEENARLLETIAAQEKGRSVIERQNKVIEEQGLRAETAEGIKAYRTAIMGGSKDEVLKKQGYLFFAADQCSYKVYEGYTIVYSLLGKMLFTINKELLAPTVNGTLNIKGKPYDYLFASNYLIIKNEKGQMVNEYGDLLDRSFETTAVIPFEKSHDFTIKSKTSPRQLLAIKTDMKTLGIEMEVFEQYRNENDIIIDLSFTLQGKEYIFQDINGISDIILEIDQPNDQLRVLSKR